MRISPKQILHGLLYAAPVILLTLAACGGGGGGGGSTTTPVVAPSAAPTGLTTYSGCYAINLNWTGVTGATSYNVYGAASGATPIVLAGVTTTSYTDAGLTGSSTSYNYQIAAANSAGVGPKTALIFASTQSTCKYQGGSIQGTALNLGNKVSTLAGTAPNRGYVDATGASAQFRDPANVTTDGTYLYVADTTNNVIRKITISTGVVTTFAGSLAGLSGTSGGTGTAAMFNGPQGITTDGTNLYVADTQSGTIRAITIASGVVSTISSGFNAPAAITFDGTDLYVANTGSTNIVKLAPTAGGASSVFATLTAAPQGITSDGTNLYATSGNNIVQISLAAGASAVLATTLNTPQGITTDGTNLYVSNTTDHTILKVTTNGGVTLVAGTAGTPGSADGTGSAARFNLPNGITTDGANLYIVDTSNNTIRKIQ